MKQCGIVLLRNRQNTSTVGNANDHCSKNNSDKVLSSFSILVRHWSRRGVRGLGLRRRGANRFIAVSNAEIIAPVFLWLIYDLIYYIPTAIYIYTRCVCVCLLESARLNLVGIYLYLGWVFSSLFFSGVFFYTRSHSPLIYIYRKKRKTTWYYIRKLKLLTIDRGHGDINRSRGRRPYRVIGRIAACGPQSISPGLQLII